MKVYFIALAVVAALSLTGCEDRERDGRRDTGLTEEEKAAKEERIRMGKEEEAARRRMLDDIERKELLGFVETALQESIELDSRWTALMARVNQLNYRYEADELIHNRFAFNTQLRTIWWELRRGAPEHI